MNPTSLNLAFAANLAALLGFGLYYLKPAKAPKFLGLAFLWAGWLALTWHLTLRWKLAGRAPMSNMYESLLVMSWGMTTLFLLLSRRLLVSGLGFWAAAGSLSVMGLAGLMDSSIQPLVPALQSNWLLYHVAVVMLGYGAFALAALGAGVHLACFNAARVQAAPDKASKAKSLDGFLERCVSLGFVLLTGGIVLGAVWANEAWGSYWSWDPKETWSLITWLFYAAAIHLRRTRGFLGSKFAWLCLAGFAFVVFTYFGVNYLLSGLHSYG